MRNSSLVKWFCAENVTGLKSATEASDGMLSDSDLVKDHGESIFASAKF